jgi:hypothetical protein
VSKRALKKASADGGCRGRFPTDVGLYPGAFPTLGTLVMDGAKLRDGEGLGWALGLALGRST